MLDRSAWARDADWSLHDLQKHKDHYSSTYNNAPMPNMQRLTWRGIALHAGHLPGYPASHGCVRLPVRFSELLYTVTQHGTPVIIADNDSPHSSALEAGLVLPQGVATDADAAKRKAGSSRKTKDNPDEVVSSSSFLAPIARPIS